MKTNDSIREELAKAKAELAAAKDRASTANADICRINAIILNLTKWIQAGRPCELDITEHATVRYAERHLGFDPTELAALVRAKIEPAYALLGDGSYPLTDELVAVVRNKTVITIKPNKY